LAASHCIEASRGPTAAETYLYIQPRDQTFWQIRKGWVPAKKEASHGHGGQLSFEHTWWSTPCQLKRHHTYKRIDFSEAF
jgi:hypothetical protein